jgi:hypothetical protein
MRPRRKDLCAVHPDEWGFYDPEQAGLAAVLDRIDERPIGRRTDDRKTRRSAARDAQRTALKDRP